MHDSGDCSKTLSVNKRWIILLLVIGAAVITTNIYRLTSSKAKGDFQTGILNLHDRYEPRHKIRGKTDTTTLAMYAKPELHPEFNPRITVVERAWMLDIFKVFIEICEEYKLTYMLYGGSLLGSFRHKDIIPWDDDFDVWMDISEIKNIQMALYSRLPVYNGSWDNSKLRYKFFHVNLGYFDKCCSWPWPSIDISFFRKTSTEVIEYDAGWAAKNFRFPKDIVFPLRKGQFIDGMSVNVPYDIEAFLKKTYDVKYCSTNSYDHVRGKQAKATKTECKNLLDKYNMYNVD